MSRILSEIKIGNMLNKSNKDSKLQCNQEKTHNTNVCEGEEDKSQSIFCHDLSWSFEGLNLKRGNGSSGRSRDC